MYISAILLKGASISYRVWGMGWGAAKHRYHGGKLRKHLYETASVLVNLKFIEQHLAVFDTLLVNVFDIQIWNNQ